MGAGESRKRRTHDETLVVGCRGKRSLGAYDPAVPDDDQHGPARRFTDSAGDVAADVVSDVVAGGLVGVAAGVGSIIFLRSLTWATSQRLGAPWLLWLLPVAGLVLGFIGARVSGDANRGTNLVLDEANDYESIVGPPLRMTFLALVGTTITHLFGGSGGREGAAVQIAAGLTAPMRRFFPSLSRRRLAVAALAGGFGSVFGVPFAGAVFGLEVQVAWRLRFRHALTSIVASFVGDFVARQLGLRHELYARFVMTHNVRVWGSVVLVGICAGLCAFVFIEGNHGSRRLLASYVREPGLRLAIGGLLVIAGVALVGTRAYLGLSLPLIQMALTGGAIATGAFALKLLFTVVTLGSGFPGGEVTPLFCVGSCLGAAMAGPLHVTPTVLAPLGFLAVFAAASHTPLACSVLAIEIFGWPVAAPALLACFIASAVCGRRSVYGAQRVSQTLTMSDVERTRNERVGRIVRNLRRARAS
jgi:H+/Cl- antiporter ClcA